MKESFREMERIPEWAIAPILYGDYSGLEEEDIHLIEDWFAETGYDQVVCSQCEPYFCDRPAFGRAAMVVDVLCIKY